MTNLRMFSVYGLGETGRGLRQGMVSIYLSLLRGEPVPVTGSLDRFRDFVYIDDVLTLAACVLQIASTPSLAQHWHGQTNSGA